MAKRWLICGSTVAYCRPRSARYSLRTPVPAPPRRRRATASTEPLIEVLDDLIPSELHAAAWTVCGGKGWYFGHGSREGDGLRFWKMDLEGERAFDSIWQHVQHRCEELAGAPLQVIRQYANGHTYGLGGQPHLDDQRPGSYTVLYYPMREWKDDWDGETVFFDERGEIAMAVRPQPNRVIFFDSRIAHAGRAPSRNCPALRVTVAYKVEIAGPAPAPHAEPPPEAFDAAEISRQGPSRVYKVRIPSGEVDKAVEEQLTRSSKNIGLPGFRPGKVPLAVLEKRYGMQARQEALNRLAGEAASRVAPMGGVASAIELLGGAQSGALEFQLTVTYLPDLPPFDFSQVNLESLTAAEADLQAAGISGEEVAALFRSHLKRQVLDRLHDAYSFPLIPAMVEREFAGLWKTAEAGLGPQPIDPKERADLAAEFREIAERRVRLGLVIAEMSRRHGIHAAQSAALEDAVIDHFVAQAQVSRRRASVDELRQMIEA